MAAVSQTAADIEATVEGARRALATAVAKANLMGDPLGPALDAMSLSLGAQLALHKAGTDHLTAVADGLDQAVSNSLAMADKELANKEAAIIGRLAPQLAAATEKSIRDRLWSIKVRAVALIAGSTAVVILASFGTGYMTGNASGFAEARRIAAAIAAGAQRDGPAAATMWAALIENNDVQPSLASCTKNVFQTNGRRACLMPIWLDPPPPPNPPHS